MHVNIQSTSLHFLPIGGESDIVNAGIEGVVPFCPHGPWGFIAEHNQPGHHWLFIIDQRGYTVIHQDGERIQTGEWCLPYGSADVVDAPLAYWPLRWSDLLRCDGWVRRL